MKIFLKKKLLKTMKIQYISFLLIFFIACQDVKEEIDDFDHSDFIEVETKKHLRVVEKIFANMPSHNEMISFVKGTGEIYNDTILNSTKNISNYFSDYKKAVNLGTYGADISYSRMYDQLQVSMNYLIVIQKLTNEIGIPEKITASAIERLQNNLNDQDSVLIIVKETYRTTDKFLKENERGSTASLIIFGGWIETFYIAIRLFDENNPNPDILEKIINQKQSLYNLHELLFFYKEEAEVEKYLKDLKILMKKFGSINNDEKMEEKIKKVSEIKKLISEIRTKIIK